MNMKKLFFVLSLVLAATIALSACTPKATPTPEVTTAPTAAPTLGTPDNPLVMALAPSATTQELIASGDSIAAQLSAITGYTITTTVPTAYGALIEAMGAGNAHIGWMPPLAYVVMKSKGYGDVGLVTLRAGLDHYGFEYIARNDAGFTSYYDAATGKDTADAKTALAQFDGKKPCWTDPYSASGYVMPLANLTSLGFTVKAGAFVQGHPTVVTAVYSKGICDFGAVYIDARSAVVKTLPDVMTVVDIIWVSDNIIPNDNVAYATVVPADMRTKLNDALLQLTTTEEGKAALKAVYNIDGLKVVDDSFYDDFRVYLQSTGLDITTLVK
jgi:phosphonate transport system substrate-binding protein